MNTNVDAKNTDGTTDYMVAAGSPHPLVEQIISLLPGDPQLNSWNKPPSLQCERPDMNLQDITIHGGEEWRQRVQESLTQHFGQDTNRHRPPLFKTGPIISSNHLLKDPIVLMSLLRMYRSVLAVEMEAAGVYEAARRPNRLYPVMVIRGISDIVGLERDEKWTAYACQTAAAFTSAFIGTGPIDPRRALGGDSSAEQLSLDQFAEDPKGQSLDGPSSQAGSFGVQHVPDKRNLYFTRRTAIGSVIAIILLCIATLVLRSILLSVSLQTAPTPSTPTQKVKETVIVNFANGQIGIRTKNRYAGKVTIEVSGTVQQAPKTSCDAFYVFTDSSGNPVRPHYDIHCALWINNQTGLNYAQSQGPEPEYNAKHIYTFSFIFRGTFYLDFAIGILGTKSISGQFIIKVLQ